MLPSRIAMTKDLPQGSSSRPPRAVPLHWLLVLFFSSGASALIYQVLWLKQLSRLFGVSAYATATTLAAFFLGLSAGAWVWGRRAHAIARPLRAYAWLEVGIGLSALLYFGLFAAYAAVQGPLYDAFGFRPGPVLALKFVLAMSILFPPAFFMGGTLPVMAQYLVRTREELGSRATLLYAVNTLGAATGAMLAGFVLARVFGFLGAYAIAIGINLVVAAVTGWWDVRGLGAPVTSAPGPEPGGRAVSAAPAVAADGLQLSSLRGIAAFSGFATLGLEVVWTRMFSRVFQNSVYTFSVILTIFLLCLALGSVVANRLCRRSSSPTGTLSALLALSGVLVVASPLVFGAIADYLEFWNSDAGFAGYILRAVVGTFVVIGPAVIVMGAVFPFLMKIAERSMTSAGRSVGELASINTVLAILGSLVAGFVLLRHVGLWASIFAIASLYFLLAIAVVPRRTAARVGAALAGFALAATAAGMAGTGVLEPVALAPESETIVESWEGPDGTVSVVRHEDDNLRIRINSSYNLGTSASAVNERLQGQLPALLHGDPESMFFLGMGTGITASGAMHFPVERVVVCEVNEDVVRGARKYFGPWLEGLFDDPRVGVYAEDGRNWLTTHDEDYDVVVADMFLSYKAGVASLYTVEHFETVRDRLAPGGIFVQWFAAFDTSPREFDILARTMLEVFPNVTLWRRSLSPVFPVFAMVGSMDREPLDVAGLRRGLGRLSDRGHLDRNVWLVNIPMAAYVANLSQIRNRFADAPVNTDDRTILEYLAPVTERNAKGARTATALAGEPLLRHTERLLEASPPESDPYLERATPAEVRHVRAGTAYYGYEVMRRLGRTDEAERYLAAYRNLLAP